MSDVLSKEMADHAAVEATKVGNAAMALFGELYSPPADKLDALTEDELQAERAWRFPSTLTALVRVTSAVLAFTGADFEVFARQVLQQVVIDRDAIDGDLAEVEKNAH
jgi:hypothetical protein